MTTEEMKNLSSKLREITGESMYFCRKMLAKNDWQIEKAAANFKTHYYDSHSFLRERD